MRVRILTAIAFSLLPGIASAQMQQQPPAAFNGFSLALQQIGTSARLLIEDMQRQMEAKDAEIAALKDKCGEPCKPKPAEPPTPTSPK